MSAQSSIETVRAETKQAYWESWGEHWKEWGRCEIERQLHFRASFPLTPAEAAEIMREACPAYNEFAPDLLLKLPEDAEVWLAREGSVCIYVKGDIPPVDLGHDEWDYDKESDETRIWWD